MTTTSPAPDSDAGEPPWPVTALVAGANALAQAPATPPNSPVPRGARMRRARSLARNWATPAHPADTAQAGVFADILQTEIAELERIVDSAEESWSQRCERTRREDRTPPPALTALRTRLDEARRLHHALQVRFLDEDCD